MFTSTPKSPAPTRQLRLRSGLRAGGPSGCMAYCAQEYDRCRVNGTPIDTCNDRLPVCQNACSACAQLYY